MTKFALACVAGLLLATPFALTTTPASAAEGIKMAQLDVRIGEPRRHYGDRHYGERRYYRARAAAHCSKTVVIRNGQKTVIKKCS